MECGKSFITFKGPVQPAAVKTREELETVGGDGPLLIRILEELGFQVWFRYEKYREEFTLEDVIVAVDETPMGTFVEIEGSERGITRWRRRSAPRGRLRPRLVPRPVRSATARSTACRAATCVRGKMGCPAGARLDGRPRNPAAAAHPRSGQARRADRRRTARPPHRPLAGEPRA